MKTQSGFTLVELLVSLALSSIIFASAYQVISNLIQYQTRAALKAQMERDRMQLDMMFTHIVEKGLLQSDLPRPQSRKPLFQGHEDSLKILSRAFSQNLDSAGYSVFRIFLRDGEIRVAHAPYGKDQMNRSVSDTPTDIRAGDIRFEYFDGSQWQPRWRDERRLPRYIRLSVRGIGAEDWAITRETAVR